MTDKILRRKELEVLVGLSRSSIYAAMAAGLFPRPIKIGRRAVGWRESVIRGWLSNCVETKSVPGVK